MLSIVLRVLVSENRPLALYWLISFALVLELLPLLVLPGPKNLFGDGLQMLMMMLVGLQVLQLHPPCRHRSRSRPSSPSSPR